MRSMLAVDGLWLWQEKEGSARGTPRPSGKLDRAEAETTGDLERQEEGNRDVTKPKQWTGRKAQKQTTRKRQPDTLKPKSPTAPVEPIPDEVDVEDNLFDKPTIGTT